MNGTPTTGGSSCSTGSLFAIVCSVLALVASAYACFVRPGSPLGSDLSSYDYSTPQAALKSDWQMERDADFLALVELQRKTRGREKGEQLRTLEIKKEATWKGKTILFASYERDGTKVYETLAYKKDDKAGIWQRDFVGPYEVREGDAALADAMQNWSQNGSLEAKPVAKESSASPDTTPGPNPDPTK